MADIVLYDETGEPVTYENVETLTTDTPTEGETATFTLGEVMDGLEVDLNLADGDQTVTAPDGKLLKDLTIKKPETLVPGNIRKGENIAGIDGTFADSMTDYIEGNLLIINDKQASLVYAGQFASNRNLYGLSLTNCKIIQSSAFAYCGNLMYADFPLCEEIQNSVFMQCSNRFSKASFPECKIIGRSAFTGCQKLSNLYLPKLKSVPDSAFMNCYKLEKFDFGNVESFVGNYIFGKCSALKEVYAPKALTVYGFATQYYGAFMSCSSLSRVYMPKMSRICISMFQSCSNLLQASFPNCTSIGSSAFRYCSNLVSMYLLGSSVPLMPYSYMFVFSGTKIEGAGTSGRIYVKESMYSAFVSATGFSYYSTKIVGLTDEEIAALDHWWEEEA